MSPFDEGLLRRVGLSTYMLTWTELEAFADGGQLRRWTLGKAHPPLGGRALYMIPSVYTEITEHRWPAADGESPTRTRLRRTAMRLVLERFVRGHRLVQRQDIKELGSNPMRACMKGFWEIRSQGPIEETRLFGHFARPGAFVATAFKPRGDFTSQEHWKRQRQECDAEWANLFGASNYMTKPWPVLVAADYLQYTDAEDA